MSKLAGPTAVVPTVTVGKDGQRTFTYAVRDSSPRSRPRAREHCHPEPARAHQPRRGAPPHRRDHDWSPLLDHDRRG
jgi:hypothetical protein